LVAAYSRPFTAVHAEQERQAAAADLASCTRGDGARVFNTGIPRFLSSLLAFLSVQCALSNVAAE
jgi:hypothetical protein